jgi:hypothetical protein
MNCKHNYNLSSPKQDEKNNLLYKHPKRPDYLIVYYHRSSALANDKGCWSISRNEEVFRFYCAHDNKNFSSKLPDLWHIEDGSNYVGAEEELISYFVSPSSQNVPWHGFPFTFGRRSPKERIIALKEVAERLLKDGKLSLKRAAKIRTGSI